jgi:GNAT superfamily N-acetyltransferase
LNGLRSCSFSAQGRRHHRRGNLDLRKLRTGIIGSMQIFIRTYLNSDRAQIIALQQRYTAAYPDAPIIPEEVYQMPSFEQGRNIFCAFSEDGQLVAYAPLLFELAAPNTEPNNLPTLPHRLWVEIKADPGFASTELVKDMLLERLVLRARRLLARQPKRPAQMIFQYRLSETPAIAYVASRGFAYRGSTYFMVRRLDDPINPAPPPPGMQIRRWKMETLADQECYIQARNEAFPEQQVRLEDWQHFMSSPQWKSGSMLAAFEGETLTGCALAFWDDVQNEQKGLKEGFTEYIFVRPAWRRKKVARSLLAAALQVLQENGLQAAILEVMAGNSRALSLYTTQGYQIQSESRLYCRSI